ncbi:LysR family transcriptional regulator [Chelativorans multitrophicus]|nr:LysR family transcriptional regulator [Chelativorans multitrophicus]
MDSLKSMELFVLAVQRGSLSAAGRHFGMAPASVSRYVNALEDRLGTRLLNRTSRSLTLTEAGEAYLATAASVIEQLAAAETRVAELGKTPSGTLRVHSRIFVGSQFIVPYVPQFLKRYPDINLVLMLSNEEINLAESNVDLDIRLGKLNDSDLIVSKLAETERCVVASPKYLDAAPTITSPADLSQHSCLVYTKHIGSSVWSFINKDGLRSDVRVSGRYTTDYGPSLKTLAVAGFGLALLPEWSVFEDVAAGRLVRLFADHRVSHIGYDFDNGVYCVWQRDRHQALKTRLFIDHLKSCFSQSAGGPLNVYAA